MSLLAKCAITDTAFIGSTISAIKLRVQSRGLLFLGVFKFLKKILFHVSLQRFRLHCFFCEKRGHMKAMKAMKARCFQIPSFCRYLGPPHRSHYHRPGMSEVRNGYRRLYSVLHCSCSGLSSCSIVKRPPKSRNPKASCLHGFHSLHGLTITHLLRLITHLLRLVLASAPAKQ